jgi:hypothetical protein
MGRAKPTQVYRDNGRWTTDMREKYQISPGRPVGKGKTERVVRQRDDARITNLPGSISHQKEG